MTEMIFKKLMAFAWSFEHLIHTKSQRYQLAKQILQMKIKKKNLKIGKTVVQTETKNEKMAFACPFSQFFGRPLLGQSFIFCLTLLLGHFFLFSVGLCLAVLSFFAWPV